MCKMTIEAQSWPYTFPASEDFPKSDNRGNVSGRLLVQDRYINLYIYLHPKSQRLHFLFNTIN